MRLSDVAGHIGAQRHGLDASVAGRCQTDSRLIEPGDIYIARIGEATDGHRFLPQAVEAGAAAAVVTDLNQALNLVPEEFPLLVVEDATVALGQIAKYHLEELRRQQDIKVIGITGSAGKTTTKDLLAQILSTVGPTVWPEGSFNNEVGLPLTVTKATPQTRYLVLEMGASAPGELTYLTKIAPLDVAVVLMVGTAHLGGFGGSRENVAKAKSELLDGLVSNGSAVLNYDDDFTRDMRKKISDQQQLYFFSAAGSREAESEAADISIAEGITQIDENHLGFTWKLKGETTPVTINLIGLHNVANALAALTAAVAVGVSPAQAAKALDKAKVLSPHRMSVTRGSFHGLDNLLVIDDAYNANLDSMKSGLDALEKNAGDRRRVVVLGQMLELGEASAKIHQTVAEYAATKGVDLLITVGDEAKSMGGHFLSKMTEISEKTDGSTVSHAETHHVASAEEAAKLLLGLSKSGDAIFLKGSNGSGVWRVADYLLKGN